MRDQKLVIVGLLALAVTQLALYSATDAILWKVLSSASLASALLKLLLLEDRDAKREVEMLREDRNRLVSAFAYGRTTANLTNAARANAARTPLKDRPPV